MFINFSIIESFVLIYLLIKKNLYLVLFIFYYSEESIYILQI